MEYDCRKDNRIPEFSGVISATRAPPTPAKVLQGHSHHTATPTPGPRRLSATHQPSRRAPQPLPKRSHPRRISTSPTPCGPVPQHAPQPSRRHRIRPQPCLRTYLPSPPAPAPSQFPRSMASPNPARPAQLYSCAILALGHRAIPATALAPIPGALSLPTGTTLYGTRSMGSLVGTAILSSAPESISC